MQTGTLSVRCRPQHRRALSAGGFVEARDYIKSSAEPLFVGGNGSLKALLYGLIPSRNRRALRHQIKEGLTLVVSNG